MRRSPEARPCSSRSSPTPAGSPRPASALAWQDQHQRPQGPSPARAHQHPATAGVPAKSLRSACRHPFRDTSHAPSRGSPAVRSGHPPLPTTRNLCPPPFLGRRRPGYSRFPSLACISSRADPGPDPPVPLRSGAARLIVMGVEADSPVDASNRKVTTLADFREALANRPEGRDLLVRILKGSKARVLSTDPADPALARLPAARPSTPRRSPRPSLRRSGSEILPIPDPKDEAGQADAPSPLVGGLGAWHYRRRSRSSRSGRQQLTSPSPQQPSPTRGKTPLSPSRGREPMAH